MKIAIIIPAFNEEAHLSQTLTSLLEQTLPANEIIVVDDGSTDSTPSIAQRWAEENPSVKVLLKSSDTKHLPGSKVVKAFNYGYEYLSDAYDIICKFDADLIFPKDYLAKINFLFESDETVGMAGGFCYIEKDGDWQLENLTNKEHIRGALKAYRKQCFHQIGGLKPAMGWDTVDELLAQYHGWKVATDESLHVKHLKPTGKTYTKASKYKQGEAFYRMRYGVVLTTIASAKLALRKGSAIYFLDYLKGYYKAKNKQRSFLVTQEEGRFIRKLRWQKIKEQLV